MTGTTSLIGFAAGAGVAAFFSPCAYALVPGYVGYYVAATGDGRPPPGGVLLRGLAATMGAFTAFALVASVTVVVGQSLTAVVPALEAVVGAVLVVIGLGVYRGYERPVSVPLPRRRATVLGFGLFGAGYAVAATACVAPLFVALVVRSLSVSPVEAAFVTGGYATTFGALLLGVTTAAAYGHRIAADVFAGRVDRIVRVSGLLVAAAGAGQLWVAFG